MDGTQAERDEGQTDVFKDKTIVGLTELVSMRGEKQTVEVLARIDTGATKSSIDVTFATKLGLGPVVDSRLIKSAYGMKLRPVVQAEVRLCGRTIRAKFTLADRDHMRYAVLIGQNILKKGFLVDPTRRADPPARKKQDNPLAKSDAKAGKDDGVRE